MNQVDKEDDELEALLERKIELLPSIPTPVYFTDRSDWDRRKFDQTVDEGDRYQLFLRWLADNGAVFDKTYLKTYSDGMRGVHASQTIEKNEVIVRIPLDLIITYEMGVGTDIGLTVKTSGVELSSPRHSYLSFFLLTAGEDPSSFFYPYVSTLPQTLSSIPMFWSEEELEFFCGSSLLYLVRDRRLLMEKDYNTICSACSEFSRFSLERFMWARMIASRQASLPMFSYCSRNFCITVDGKETAALVPLADMLNHCRPSETSWKFEDASGGFEILSTKRIPSGNQVLDSYGVKSNHRFLLNYGFAMENNVEEDGSCPNQVFELLCLPPSDIYYSRKLNLLTSCGVSSVVPVHISDNYFEERTNFFFSILRIIFASDHDLRFLERRLLDSTSKPINFCFRPLSRETEYVVIAFLAFLAKHRLKGYPTTIEEDRVSLFKSSTSQRDYPFFSNARNARLVMLGEKIIYQHYLSLAEIVLPLFEMDMAVMLFTIEKKYNTMDPIGDYCARVIHSISDLDEDGISSSVLSPYKFEDYFRECPAASAQGS